MKLAIPIPLKMAQSMMDDPTAPDWEKMEMLPTGGSRCANVALTPAPGFMTPKQLGPRNLTPASLATLMSSFSSSAPAALSSLNPAVRMAA